jgi:hypothetical protein
MAIPRTYVPVPGEWIEYSRSFRSSKFEADDGRTFWVSHKFLRIDDSGEWIDPGFRIKYLEPGRLRGSMKEAKRTLKQRMEVTQFPSLRHRREFETALATGKVRQGKRCEYRYVTTANNGRRTLNRISLGGIFTSETI